MKEKHVGFSIEVLQDQVTGSTRIVTKCCVTSPPHTPTPTPLPPPPPPLFNTANAMKMPIFKGLGIEDLEQFWFVANVVWKSQQITDEDLKKAQLVTTLQDRALSWYIKYCTRHPYATLKDTKDAMNNEFKKPKSQAQSVTEVKEIRQKVNEFRGILIKG